MKGQSVLVTGGAGFIGSHLTGTLLNEGNEVTVIDNLSSGKMEFLSPFEGNRDLSFLEMDLLDAEAINEVVKDFDWVFHLAANPDVRLGASDTFVHLEQNVIATYNLLEAMRVNGVIRIAFTSTSTVYGEAETIPTPEDYGPLVPISLYGSSKLACEGLISAYCHSFDMFSLIYRFANCVGPDSTHGVIFDFVHKLKENPRKLEILGDGKQTKSYFYMDDCLDALVFSVRNTELSEDQRVEIYNIGSEDWADVNAIADIVCEVSGLDPDGVRYEYTGGVDGGRGWKGDVKIMRLSVEKLKEMGWRPSYGSDEAIREAAKSLV